MIDRYSRDQMKKVWSENNKYDKWLEVEISVCQAWHKQTHYSTGVMSLTVVM